MSIVCLNNELNEVFFQLKKKHERSLSEIFDDNVTKFKLYSRVNTKDKNYLLYEGQVGPSAISNGNF